MRAAPRAAVSLLTRQLSKFGTVGIIGVVIDVGLFNLLLYAGAWPSVSKTASMGVAMMFTYAGNKFWSFGSDGYRPARPRRGFSLSVDGKQFVFFLLANFIALSFSLAALYVEHEILGIRGVLADNIAANVIGLGLGTIFRFWAYRVFVFPPVEGLTAQEEEVRERQIMSPEV